MDRDGQSAGEIIGNKKPIRMRKGLIQALSFSRFIKSYGVDEAVRMLTRIRALETWGR
jgi:hypothetical protein